jgi:hydroxymethylglutaryl-CoA lyase
VATRIELIRRMERAGATRIETVSFASPKHVPQMAGAEEICSALADRSFAAIGLVLNARGLERALACDLDEINVVAYAADGYARKNSGAGATERNAEALELVARARETGRRTSVTIAVAFGDPVDGAVAPAHVIALAAAYAAAGAGEIALGDTIGVGNPAAIEYLLPAVAAAASGASVRCHFHNTRNAGYANAVAAARSGARALDAAVGGFGGSPFSPGAGGNVATEDLVSLLHGMGIATGVDPIQTAATGAWLAERLGYDRPPAMLGRATAFPGSA